MQKTPARGRGARGRSPVAGPPRTFFAARRRTPQRAGRLAALIALSVLAVFSSGRGVLAEAPARLTVDVSKLPGEWSTANCRSSEVNGGPGAVALFGNRIAPNRWNRLVLVFVETASADRTVSESEAKNSTIIDIGPGRPRARLQVVLGQASVDWWDKGLQVGIVAAASDRSGAIAVARTISVASNGSAVSLRASPPPRRIPIARSTLPGSGIDRLTCDTGPGGPTLMIESGAGVDAGTPPVLAGDELIRFTVASKPAWRTSRTVKLVDGGRVLAVTSCSLSMKLSATTKATFIGPAPCDGLVADAAALPGAVTQPQG